MKTPKLVALAILVCVLVLPVAARAQCTVTTTMINTFPPNISVYKVLDVSVTCTSLMNMNVNACFPTAVPNNTMFLVASAPSMGTMPASCSFRCYCGVSTPTFTIDGGDGLPVELMDFAVDDGDDSEASEDE